MRIVLVLLAAGALAGAALWRVRERLPGWLLPLWTTTTYDVPYGPSAEQRLDVLRRRWGRRQAAPGVVLFHGGAWRIGNREEMRAHFCRFFLERGFVVANVEYRKGAILPALEDAAAAVDWVSAHAAELGIDRERLVVAGVSAGAHLALWAGLGPGARPAGIVNFYGFSDLTKALDSEAVRRALPEHDREAAARYASPVTRIAATAGAGGRLPPVLSLHGSADTVVRPEQTRLLTSALRAAGGEADEAILPGARHGFQPQIPDEAAAAIDRFLRTHGLMR